MRTVFGVVVLALLGFAAYQRSTVWQSEEALWAEAARLSPEMPRPHLNLGIELEKRGQYDAAMREFELAQYWSQTTNRMEKHQRMSQASAESNISLLMLVEGRFHDARDMATHAIEVYPEIKTAYVNRATANLAMGHCALAILDYSRVGIADLPRCGPAAQNIRQ